MSTYRPTVDPIYLASMQGLAKAIDETFNGNKRGKDRLVGFCLLIFPFSEEVTSKGERVNYISNVERADMVTALKEVIARFEDQDYDLLETKQ